MDGRIIQPQPTGERRRVEWRTLTVVSIVVITVIVLLWAMSSIVLLTFAGILLAVLLRGLSDWICAYTPLPAGWALAMVICVLALVLAAGVWILAPRVAAQTDDLVDALSRAVSYVQEHLSKYQWGKTLLHQVEQGDDMLTKDFTVLAKVTDAFSTSLGLLIDVIIVLFVGLFLAAQPQVYLTGLLHLLPREKRPRAREVLHAMGYTLKWWIIGQFTSMSIVGFLFALGLWLLNVPLAITLGLLATGLAFIPYIGPLLAAVPALLFALTQGPTHALYVLVLYTAIQLVESYVLTPLIQRQAVLLPPVLTILAQVLLGMFLGGLGLMLATPLVAITLVLVKMLYIEDILGEPVQITGNSPG